MTTTKTTKTLQQRSTEVECPVSAQTEVPDKPATYLTFQISAFGREDGYDFLTLSTPSSTANFQVFATQLVEIHPVGTGDELERLADGLVTAADRDMQSKAYRRATQGLFMAAEQASELEQRLATVTRERDQLHKLVNRCPGCQSANLSKNDDE